LKGTGPAVRIDVADESGRKLSPKWVGLQEGVSQGDTLGPFFFALGLDQHLMAAKALIQREEGDVTILAQADDVRLVGHPAHCRKFMDALVQTCAEKSSTFGLNAAKCKAMPNSEEAMQAFRGPDSQWASLQLVTEDEGIVAGGVPFGSDDFVTGYWRREAEETVKTFLARLKQVRSLQIRMLLLRQCAVSKTTFMLRASPPALVASACTIYETAFLDVAKTCLPLAVHAASMTAEMEAQACLPLSMGGLGLTKPSDVAPGAYIAGFAAALSVLLARKQEMAEGLIALYELDTSPHGVKQHMQQLSTKWKSAVDEGLIKKKAVFEFPVTAPDLVKLSKAKETETFQSRMTGVAHRIALAKLLRSSALATYDHARLRSLRQEGAMAALAAVPYERALTLSNNAFALKIATVLGCKATLKHYADLCGPCGSGSCKQTAAKAAAAKADKAKAADSQAQHLYNCKAHGGHIVRHDLMRNEINCMLKQAGFVTQVEPRAQYEGTGNGGPDIDVTDLGFTPGRPNAFVEVAVVHPGSKSLVKNAANIDLSAAAAVESRKEKDWKTTSADHEVIPAVVETYGAFGKHLKTLIKRCQQSHTRKEGAPRPVRFPWPAMTFGGYWRERLAVALCKGAAEMARRITGGRQFEAQSSAQRKAAKTTAGLSPAAGSSASSIASSTTRVSSNSRASTAQANGKAASHQASSVRSASAMRRSRWGSGRRQNRVQPQDLVVTISSASSTRSVTLSCTSSSAASSSSYKGVRAVATGSQPAARRNPGRLCKERD
jgi:hypothetical protein